MKKFRLPIVFVLIYAIYIASLPRILSQFIHCLDSFHNATVDYQDCNVILVTNTYLLIGFIGSAIGITIYALVTKMKSRFEIMLLGIAFSIILVFGFYQYLPEAQSVTRSSNIYLDTFHDEYGKLQD